MINNLIKIKFRFLSFIYTFTSLYSFLHSQNPFTNSLSHISKLISYIFFRGDIIYKELIKKYIPKLTIDDIKRYAQKNNIYITNSEAIIIYNFIKENYLEVLNGHDEKIFALKSILRKDLYDTIIKLYIENKTKYLS